MKSLFFLLFIVLSFSIQAQELSIKATRQHWAGGACCATGTNYHFTVSGDSTELNSISFEYIVIDGNHFDITPSCITNYGKGFKTFYFGISRNNHREILIDEEIKIEKNQKNEGCYLMIKYNGTLKQVDIKSVEELMYLAYP